MIDRVIIKKSSTGNRAFDQINHCINLGKLRKTLRTQTSQGLFPIFIL